MAMPARTIRIEATFVGHEPEAIDFDDVTFTYVAAEWITKTGAGSYTERNLKEPPRLDVQGLPPFDLSAGWTTIFFPGVGEQGLEIIHVADLGTGVIRFTLRGA